MNGFSTDGGGVSTASVAPKLGLTGEGSSPVEAIGTASGEAGVEVGGTGVTGVIGTTGMIGATGEGERGEVGEGGEEGGVDGEA
jgi:hypothetical protein